MNKKYNSFIDYFKVTIGSLAFIVIIVLSIWATALIIAPNPDLDPDAFVAQMIARGVLTILLVTSGVNLVYDVTKIIIVGSGARSYSKKEATTTPGYRYVAAQEEISEAKAIIDKHGLILELEETVDFINLERKVNRYEDMVDAEIYKLTKHLQSKKVARDPNKVKELRNKINDVKARKSIIAKFRTSVTKFERLQCIEYDEKLAEIYGEPHYDIVYSKDIYNMKNENRSLAERIMNSAFFIFMRERIQPIINPLIFTATLTYYIVSFDATANNIALLITVGATTLMSMGGAGLRELRIRFSRVNVDPLEANSYIFKKFKAKNKTLIEVLDKGELTIEQYHELQKHKLAVLKTKMEKVMEENKESELK
jgi:hypothetical protein